MDEDISLVFLLMKKASSSLIQSIRKQMILGR